MTFLFSQASYSNPDHVSCTVFQEYEGKLDLISIILNIHDQISFYLHIPTASAHQAWDHFTYQPMGKTIISQASSTVIHPDAVIGKGSRFTSLNGVQGVREGMREINRDIAERAGRDPSFVYPSRMEFALQVSDVNGQSILHLIGENESDLLEINQELASRVTDILDDLATGDTTLEEHGFLGKLLARYTK